MTTELTQFAASSNGDIWLLATADGSGVECVVHRGNEPSGGHETRTPVPVFLDLRPRGPEHEALIALLDKRMASNVTRQQRRVLITGGSIAGCACAWWLARYGFAVTVVEKAPDFRDGGQNIDIRGAGRDVMRRMDLEAAALRQGTGEEGTAFIREDGSVAGQFITSELGADGPTAEMEILRGDLARLIYDEVKGRATFRFDDSISTIEQDSTGATVTFKSGIRETFYAVIVAEGVGSPTRELVFPSENSPRWMDMTTAYFTIPRTPDDDMLWRWFHTTRGRSVSLRPDLHGTTRAMLSVQKPSGREADWTAEEQKAWLRGQFADVGWQAPRVLREMDTTKDFYFDALRQVRMPRWSNSRVALVGDAAWCVTPLGGVGATLAVVGAYILAGEMANHPELSSAYADYERKLRGYVEKAQGIPKFVPRLANPHSRFGLAILNGVVRLASVKGISRALGKLLAGKSKDLKLPEYEGASVARVQSSALQHDVA